MKRSKNVVHFNQNVQSFHTKSTKLDNSKIVKILKENAVRKLYENNLQPANNSNTNGKIMF